MKFLNTKNDFADVANKENQIDSLPLVVDLDGTFLNTDLLYEGIILLLKHNPLMIFVCIIWILDGKLYFKKQIFKRVSINYRLLPLNQDVYSFIKDESSKGRKIILATASMQVCAENINSIYNCFSEVYGSNHMENLSGRWKLNFLVKRFGQNGFDYIGNSKEDLVIFENSRYAYLNNPSKKVEKEALKFGNIVKTWKPTRSKFQSVLKSIRIYQWVKNGLIFIPLLTSYSFFSIDLIIKSFIAFIAFSLVASSGYLLNDLMDIDSDRSHVRKKMRPFASGDLGLLSGMVILILLLLLGLCLSIFLTNSYFYVLSSYFIVSLTYSLYLKKIVLFDVFLLTSFYSTRVISGGLVTGIEVSFWLIAFSIFIFLSLAFVKRYSELIKMKDELVDSLNRRGYTINDMGLLQAMGLASGYMSVIVFSLYLNSAEVRLLYENPEVLWFLSFLLLFWISRMWLITSRGQMHDDPIIFAIQDAGSHVILGLTTIVLYLAKIGLS